MAGCSLSKEERDTLVALGEDVYRQMIGVANQGKDWGIPVRKAIADHRGAIAAHPEHFLNGIRYADYSGVALVTLWEESMLNEYQDEQALRACICETLKKAKHLMSQRYEPLSELIDNFAPLMDAAMPHAGYEALDDELEIYRGYDARRAKSQFGISWSLGYLTAIDHSEGLDDTDPDREPKVIQARIPKDRAAGFLFTTEQELLITKSRLPDLQVLSEDWTHKD